MGAASLLIHRSINSNQVTNQILRHKAWKPGGCFGAQGLAGALKVFWNYVHIFHSCFFIVFLVFFIVFSFSEQPNRWLWSNLIQNCDTQKTAFRHFWGKKHCFHQLRPNEPPPYHNHIQCNTNNNCYDDDDHHHDKEMVGEYRAAQSYIWLPCGLKDVSELTSFHRCHHHQQQHHYYNLKTIISSDRSSCSHSGLLYMIHNFVLVIFWAFMPIYIDFWWHRFLMTDDLWLMTDDWWRMTHDWCRWAEELMLMLILYYSIKCWCCDP